MTASTLWKYFYQNKTYYKSDKTHKNAWCHGCLDARKRVMIELDASKVRAGLISGGRSQEELDKAALACVDPIAGKAERMKTHVKQCKNMSDDERTLALLSATKAAPRLPSQNITGPSTFRVAPISSPVTSAATHVQVVSTAGKNSNSNPIRRSRSLYDNSLASGGGVRSLAKNLSPSDLQDEFSADLCRLLIELNTAWAAADRPGLHRFIHKWVGPEVAVQDRRILSGRVLDKEVKKVEAAIRLIVQGKLATGECDGWKNVAKSNVITSLMTVDNVPYLIQTHDVTRDPKTGDHLLKLVLEDLALMEKLYGVQAQFPWLIALLCWAHQINLIVGDVLGVRGSVTDDINHALEVVKWFNNHGTALELLRQEQVLTFSRSFWALILPPSLDGLPLPCCHASLKAQAASSTFWTRNEDRLILCAGAKEELKEKARQIQG
ncbi:hypothetical protein BDZ97DRAFT_2001757 [Flammula alnicola]|nr:hypothetical protein BDZ97DRAFT_2001757 [Flammula alnicola]